MQDYFDTQSINNNLRTRAIRGGMITLIGQGTKLGINTISIIVLARLLTPADYGLVAMVAAFTSFLEIFKTLGLMDATVQGQNIKHEQVSSLFYINVITGFVLSAITLCLAPALTAFYGDPRVFWLTVAFAVPFMISGFSIQHNAILRRQMRYFDLIRFDITYIITSTAVAIGAALIGYGYWSLVIGTISAELTAGIFMWTVNRWRPSRRFNFSDVRAMVGFGANIQLANILAVIPIKLDNILIGRFWGTVPLGIYSRAFNLTFMPLEQFVESTRFIAVPTLSRLQHDAAKFRQYYLKAISLVTHFSMPTTMFFILMSPDIIYIVLGAKWSAAAEIFRILCVVAFAMPIGESSKWINVSLGRGRQMLHVSTAISISFIVAILLGLPYGPIGVASAISLSYWIVLFPVLIYALRNTPASLKDLLSAIWKPFLIALVLGVTLFFLNQILLGWHPALRLITAGAIALPLVIMLSTWLAGQVNPISYVRNAILWIKEARQ